MPAEELFALADRWRQDPTGAGHDGQLLAETRAALASLDGRERAALGDQLRDHGAAALAERLEASDRLPVWSDEFTAVAREVLTVDDATLADLREAASPGALSDLPAPSGDPVGLPPPPADASPVDHLPPPTSESPPDPGARTTATDTDAAPAGEEAPTSPDLRRPPGPADEPSPVEPDPTSTGSPAWQARRWQPRDPQSTSRSTPAPPSTTSAPRFDAAGGAAARALRGESEVESLAPGVRSSVVARTRFVQLAELVAEGVSADAAARAIAEAPDGWQRRRVILRLLDADVGGLDADEVLRSLARSSDRTAVADRLLRRGLVDLDELADLLPPGPLGRLVRRHRG